MTKATNIEPYRKKQFIDGDAVRREDTESIALRPAPQQVVHTHVSVLQLHPYPHHHLLLSRFTSHDPVLYGGAAELQRHSQASQFALVCMDGPISDTIPCLFGGLVPSLCGL